MATSVRSDSASDAMSPPPPLQNGDHLTRDEFERRYAAMPYLKKAELVEGIVYIPTAFSYGPEVGATTMASPVGFGHHSAPHFDLITWLGLYRLVTPGVRGGDNGSIRLDINNLTQPDAFLIILPSLGGQARISSDDYVEGAPELIAEVAASSASYDLHVKLNVYRRNGVREYIVWRVYDRAVDWFILRNGQYERLAAGPDGLYRSEAFPGLWLDAAALVAGDMAAVNRAAQQGLASPEHAAFAQRMERLIAAGPQATNP